MALVHRGDIYTEDLSREIEVLANGVPPRAWESATQRSGINPKCCWVVQKGAGMFYPFLLGGATAVSRYRPKEVPPIFLLPRTERFGTHAAPSSGPLDAPNNEAAVRDLLNPARGVGYDYLVDVWSLGAVAYLLSFGRFPYTPMEQTSASMKDAISKELSRLKRCCSNATLS